MKRTYILIPIASIIIFIAAFIIFFARVIPRTVPTTGIVSPASGKVISVFDTAQHQVIFEKQGTTNNVTIPEIAGPVHVILIELNLDDVHIQRAPISGIISRMDHYDGDHVNALGKDKETIVATNEKTITVFKNDTTTVGVVQVAGRAARRIRNYSPTQSAVTKGQVYGRILLGSQVVVILPQSTPLDVAIGDRVVDGETIIAH